MSSVDLRRGTVRWSSHQRSAAQLATSLTLLLGSLLSSAYSSPVFPFTSFQASRNLRHLPCVVRNTGEEGICMFAIDCFKANGTHLGVCIDKIFFGSCCQVNDDRLLFDPDITDNSIDHNSVGNFQHFPPSVNTHRKPPLTETRLPTTAPGNGTKYELLSTSTTTRRTTSKNNRRTTSTTVRTTKAPQKVQQKDDLQTTTEYQEFTTFQYVQSSKTPAGSSSPTSNKRPSARPSPSLASQDNRVSTTRTTTYKPYKTRRPTTNKTSTVRPPNRRPAQPLTTTTEAPTATPPSTTRKVSGQNTRHPTTSSTIASRKPPSSIAASQTQTTIASRRPATTQSTPKPESTTPSVTYSRRPTTSPSLVPLTKPTTNRRRPTTTTTTTTKTTVPATTSSETTRAPRPRPKPTSQVATVPATSLDHLVETHSSSSEATSSSAVPSSSTSKPTYPSTTVKVTQPTTPTPTPTPASSTTRSTQSEPSVQSSTIKVPEVPINLGDSEDLASLSRPGLVTWTSILEDTPTERPSSNQGTSSTTDAWSSSKRPPAVDVSSTTETMLVLRETTTAAEESIESATEGSGEEESGSGSEEGSSEEEEEEEGEEGEEGTDESEETTDATTASIENATDATQHKQTNESTTPVTSSSTASSTSAAPSSSSSSSSPSTMSSTSLEPSTMTASTLSPVSISTTSTSSSSPSTLSTANNVTTPTSAPVTSDRGPTTTQGMSTTGMPIKFPELPASNQTALPTTTTLAMLANVTTDGVTLAPDFLTTSTLPTLEGIDYRSVCGKRMFPEPRIVGGTKAAFGRWPWQISLRQWRTSTYLHKCGAALLNENWAITAAHCVDNVPPSDLLLRLGEYDLALEEEPYGYQERRVQIVASHPQFDPRTFEYDLALLRFYEPVVFQPNIIPVCVPENDENFIGRTAFVTGWGRLYEDGPLPSVLQEVTVPVIENKICETMYRSAGYIEHIPHIFICAGWKKGGYDSCEGDSGGPMVIQRTDKRFLLAGVISWGIGCAEPNQPGVYTRISEFRDWINQILQF
ncbi:mucin-5AC isoform X2 [Anopheles merus]|uniref:mucin-5AC isoform X2 n=1 Tax=Anopheles merus TaxID=30066 RepID=UPI001BE4202E|nr:mucin-5AC isoform X2 [Anopheles merus]